MDQTLPILVYLVLALAVTRIPYLKVYFSLCNTLLHEVIKVMLNGGIRNKIILHKDGTGGITKSGNSRFKNTLITYAGYTGASLTAIALFYLVTHQNYHFILYLFIGLMVVASLLWIRNFFGIMWALSFVALLAVLIYFRYDAAITHLSIFLASFILVQSIINGIHVCRYSLLDRKNPERSGILVNVKIIPAFMLGVVLLGQSLYTGYFIVKNILSLH